MPRFHPCPGCGASSRARGRIPAATQFGGRALSEPLPPRWLHRCGDCRLVFAAPNPTTEELNRLYNLADVDYWDPLAGPRDDWSLAAELIGQMSGVRSVLDVGCATGDFLAMLPPEIERFGIEVRTAAADAAAGRGVTIVGGDHRSLVATLGTYDVVVAFDVLEHVTDPADILRKASEVLAPGGRVIFSTGNADAWTWRFMGSRYWYSWYPEHLSFVSSSWIDAHAGSLGFEVERAIRLTRAPGNLDARGRAREFAKNAAYRVLPLSTSAAVKGRRQGGVHLDSPAQGAPPNWVDARDHVMAVLRKS